MNPADKLKAYSQTHPNRSKVLLGLFALIALLLISTAIALIMQANNPKNDHPSTQVQTIANIQITNKGFVPANLVVHKGTKIIWTNTDKKTHQIQANPHPTGDSLPGLKSEILNNSQTYEYTANQPGTYHYHDHLTPTTNGTFEVQE